MTINYHFFLESKEDAQICQVQGSDSYMYLVKDGMLVLIFLH
jgi:hypothetical protein